jgi:DNA-binding transcriptional MerR regulator
MAMLAIGRLSKDSGVKIPTIRYYESIGLLPPPVRSEGNRRMYPPEAVRRLRFIRHARELGFEIDAIRRLADLAQDPAQPCCEADLLARRRLIEIEEKISRLAAQRDELVRMIGDCTHGRIEECRVIDTLDDHAKCLHARH